MDEAMERERLVLNARIEISESTMQNISQELHDNIGQRLTLAKMNLSEDGGVLEQNIQNSRELITKALQDLRDLSKSLNKNYILDLGLEIAVQKELKLVQSSSGIECKLKCKGEFQNLNEQSEVIVFRCIQEALNNAVKYSEATLIEVSIEFETNVLWVAVEDNGLGFDMSDVVPGVGLNSIKQRMKSLGGEVVINSSSGKGTRVELKLKEEFIH